MVTRRRPHNSPGWTALARHRWLVLAPHPDDETLGAGALIAHASKTGMLKAVVYLTDGGGSHPVRGTARKRLVQERCREAWRAIQRLSGRQARRPIHLGWRDAQPHTPDSPKFLDTLACLTSLVRRRRITAIAVTSLDDPHCDHQVAARLAHACAATPGVAARIYEYGIWTDTPPRRVICYRTPPVSTGKRRAALQCHRSQLTGAFGNGFRLPREFRTMPAADLLYSRRYAHAV